MKKNLQNFSGLFQINPHTRSKKFLWMLSIPVSFSIITFGIWVIVVGFFDSSQSLEPQFFETALIVLFTLVLPVLGLFISLTQIHKKPGVYLRGIRVTKSGIEVGTLVVDLDSLEYRHIREKTNPENTIEGNWIQEKAINNEEAIDILIVLNTGCDAMRLISFERFVISSRQRILYQLIGKNSTETICNDLVAISNGSIRLLGNTTRIPTNHLFQFLGLVADVISTCRALKPPSCTLQLVPSLANLGNVLAFGMLGGINTAWGNYPKDKELSEYFPDKNFAKSLRKFLKEKGWGFSN